MTDTHKIYTLPDITSKPILHDYLHVAMEIELATIPPYMTALYSIITDTVLPGSEKERRNQDAYDVIQSVLLEEMLHLTLAGNLLKATGGETKIRDKEFVPDYPTPLPHSDAKYHGKTFLVPLQRLSEEAIDVFMRIEKPEEKGTPPEGEGWSTIGQFYDEIRKGFQRLHDEIGAIELFSGDEERQIRPEDYYGGSGAVIEVIRQDDPDRTKALERAKEAIEQIIEQGEGTPMSIWDGDTIPTRHGMRRKVPAHFFRFNEIKEGHYYKDGDCPGTPSSPGKPTGDPLSVDWNAVYPIRENTHSREFKDYPEIYAKLMDCNRTYMRLLELLDTTFNENRESLMEAVGVMYDLKYKVIALMKIPNPIDQGQTNVGPSFEYVAPGE